MAEDRRDVGLLAVTSADRLNAGWTAAQRARERGLVHARSHIERLLADVPPNCALVTVLDGHPATLAWLGAVQGHRTRVARRRAFRPDRHFGRTSTGITASTRKSIVAAARGHRARPADPAFAGDVSWPSSSAKADDPAFFAEPSAGYPAFAGYDLSGHPPTPSPRPSPRSSSSASWCCPT